MTRSSKIAPTVKLVGKRRQRRKLVRQNITLPVQLKQQIFKLDPRSPSVVIDPGRTGSVKKVKSMGQNVNVND